jgi:hypothetical protein
VIKLWLTNASTPTTPLSQFVPFAALSQAQIAPIASRPVLRVKRMLDGHRHPAALEDFSKQKSYETNDETIVFQMTVYKKICKISD